MELNSREKHDDGTLASPKCIRKIFAAKLSTDVDLEFQVYTFADATTTPMSIYKKQDFKYLYSMLFPDNFTSSPPFLKQTDITKSFQSSIANLPPITDNDLNNINEKEIICKGIDDINKQLLKVYENLTAVAAVLNGKNMATRNTKHENEVLLKLLQNFIISNNITKNIKDRNDRKARNLKCKVIKKLFSNDRVCCCKCRANKTMCRACAASDAVITEIMFEFDNLSEYMRNHCTEIQTYFFMNPTGGRRLKDSVHRLDKVLNDYYKRVKGKCQGPTCKSLGGMQPLVNISKRSNKNQSLSDFITSLQNISSNVKHLLDSHTNDDIAKRTKCFLIETKKCFHIPINDKNEWNRDRRQAELTNVYSIDKFYVNILTCKNRSKDSSKNKFAVTEGHRTSRYFNTTSNTFITQPESLRDYENIDEVKRNSYSKLDVLKKMWPHIFKTRAENVFTFTEKLYPEEPLAEQSHKFLDRNKKPNNKNKRDLEVQPTQLESPLITDPGGMFWYNYLSKKMVKDVTAKVTPSQINILASMDIKSTTESVKLRIQENSKVREKNEIENGVQKTNRDEDYGISKNDSLAMFKLYELINELGVLINLLSSTSPSVINERTKTSVLEQSTTKRLSGLKDGRNFTNKLKTPLFYHVTEATSHNSKSTVYSYISYPSSEICNDDRKPTDKDANEENSTIPVDLIKDTKKIFNITIVKSIKPLKKQKDKIGHNNHEKDRKGSNRVVPINIDKCKESTSKSLSTSKSKINNNFNESNIHHSTNNNENIKYDVIKGTTKSTTKSTRKSSTKSSTKSTTELAYSNIREENELPQVDLDSYPEFTEEGNNDGLDDTSYPTIIIINKALKKFQEPFDEIPESKSNENRMSVLNKRDEYQIKRVDDKYHDLLISILNHGRGLRDDQNTVT